MAMTTWQTLETRYCDDARTEVCLEIEVAYPSDTLPDQPPRVKAHRCSNVAQCNQFAQTGCIWTATGPEFQLFRGK